jgi:hypothetical protein
MSCFLRAVSLWLKSLSRDAFSWLREFSRRRSSVVTLLERSSKHIFISTLDESKRLLISSETTSVFLEAKPLSSGFATLYNYLFVRKEFSRLSLLAWFFMTVRLCCEGREFIYLRDAFSGEWVWKRELGEGESWGLFWKNCFFCR